jgi:maleate isomerase
MEPELNKMVPRGVAVYATRLLLERGLPENLEKLATDTEQASDLLKTADVTGILYGCTSGSLIKGWVGREIIRRIESRTVSCDHHFDGGHRSLQGIESEVGRCRNSLRG